MYGACVFYVQIIGKPTLNERMQIFIEALDLGISTPPLSETSQPTTTVTPKSTTQPPTRRQSTRSLNTYALIRTPSTKRHLALSLPCSGIYCNRSRSTGTTKPHIIFPLKRYSISLATSQPFGSSGSRFPSFPRKRAIEHCPDPVADVHKICTLESKYSMCFTM